MSEQRFRRCSFVGADAVTRCSLEHGHPGPCTVVKAYGLSEHEPMPVASSHPAIYDLLYQDLRERDNYGKNKYGVRLQPFNGRHALKDMYQEVMDLAVYTRQALYEQEQGRSWEGGVMDAIKMTEWRLRMLHVGTGVNMQPHPAAVATAEDLIVFLRAMLDRGEFSERANLMDAE